jgi:hypothetical protein
LAGQGFYTKPDGSFQCQRCHGYHAPKCFLCNQTIQDGVKYNNYQGMSVFFIINKIVPNLNLLITKKNKENNFMPLVSNALNGKLIQFLIFY